MADREQPTLKELWRETPHKPGVYIMKDARGNTIYVGKAKDLHRRLGNYFSPTGEEKNLLQFFMVFFLHFPL